MDRDDNAIRILAFVAVGSYFAYVIYWFVKAIPWIIEISLRPEYYSPATGLRFTDSYSISTAYLMEYSGFFGLTIRAVGAVYALISAFLILKTETNSFSVVRDKISKALLLEGLYFFSFIPAIYFLLGFSALPSVSNFLLSTSLFVQILLISPFLVNLGLKVRKYESGVGESSLLRLAGFSSMNYVIALWVTYISKWAEMTAVTGLGLKWLLTQPYVLGFLNTIVIQSLAVAFAVVGAFSVLGKSDGDKTMRWWGLSSIFLSVHTIFYVIYCASVGILRFIPFGELWTIPLLGLGMYLLLKNPKVKNIP